MRTVQLNGPRARGRVAIIDDEDYALVSQHSWHIWEWHASHGRHAVKGPYACTTLKRGGPRTLGMHRLITGFPMTDHIDHDGLNNQRSNLRLATRAENAQNMRPSDHSSTFRGVTWHRKCGKWQALIQVDGRSLYLGLYVSERDAADAYDQAAIAAWGEYAYLNRATP